MEYIKTFESYNQELVLEKINLQSLIDNFKKSSNKKVLAKVLVGTLLTVLTMNQVFDVINKRSDITEQEKTELLKAATNINKEDIKKIQVEEVDESQYKDPQTLKLSQDGWDHIREHEKLRLKAYSIGDGMITIGYGHAEPKKKSKYKLGQKITVEEANRLLRKDVNFAAAGVRRMFNEWKEEGIEVNITQNQYDVLVSMAFNMGVSGLRQTQFVQLLKQNRLKKAAEKIKSTGISDKFPGLEVRRKKESDKFKS